MRISDETRALAHRAEIELAPVFGEIDEISAFNTERVLGVFREMRVSEAMFAPSTGYGYGDRGRDAVDRIAAKIFGFEHGFMRPSILCGTHAITIALFGLLRPGDVMLSVTGTPYDTLHAVIGLSGEEGGGSLRDFGVGYQAVELVSGDIDYEGVRDALAAAGDKLKVLYIQRSKGYTDRKTLSPEEIDRVISFARSLAGDGFYAVVDNCYGEFTSTCEPKAADLLIGSLIKNPGGGMADVGGYIVGTKKAVELAGNRLVCPGVALEVGASLGQNRNMLKGLFYAPHTTAQALKTAHLAAYMLDSLGYKVSPAPFERRHDIVQTVSLGSPEALSAFLGAIQSASPVDSYVTPEAWDMPGYDDRVIMAAGAFVGGASIELSADGPMRPPYTAFMQGGLTYEAGRFAVMRACDEVGSKK